MRHVATYSFDLLHCAATDPRSWTREDVSTFLKWFQEEFDLPSIDFDKFCMNGEYTQVFAQSCRAHPKLLYLLSKVHLKRSPSENST
jgi:hypothetical protein